MRLRWSLLVGLPALVSAAVLAGPAAAYPARSCGKFGSSTLYSHLKKGGNHKCPQARSMTQHYVSTGHNPSGYRCYRASWSIPVYCSSKSNSTHNFFLKR
ncbi:MAG: hypothetical protein QOK04_1675 [Solirubrobacteraceae bacterium]|jgi:hypothetical protein|nr:hypothetical protein [Solirubrobacteraceae bacterium]